MNWGVLAALLRVSRNSDAIATFLLSARPRDLYACVKISANIASQHGKPLTEIVAVRPKSSQARLRYYS